MRNVAVLGVGMSKFGISKQTNLEMFAEAALEALIGSGLRSTNIQALFFGNCLGGFEEGQLHMASFAAAEIGLPVNVSATRFEAACATATVAFRHAALLVASGVYDLVLVGGVERAAKMDTALATKTFAMGSDACYETPSGITFPGVFAMAAFQYADKYGLELGKLKVNLAAIAVKAHRHAMHNSLAHFQKEIDESTVLNSIYVADPLQLFDCCPFSDGAAAVVLASGDLAKRVHPKPIWVVGLGQASHGSLCMQKDLTVPIARVTSVKQAMVQAGVMPQDLDVIELHDCFTIAEVLALEAIGIYDWGKAYSAAARGETTYGGKVVVNPSGGLKAKGHPIGATGASQICEIVWQLRGEAKERQVEGAKIGMVDTLGGDFGTNANVILRS